MRIRSIDSSGDWNFGLGLQSYYINNNQAIAENIQTTILSFYHDCWFSPSSGIDWLTLLGTNAGAQKIQLTVKGTILQCYGVTKVNSVSTDQTGRALTIIYNINTIFSQNFTDTILLD